VQWSSRDAPRPEVRWGADAERLNRTTAADSDSYDADDLCGPPATAAGWLEPGLLHRALLTDLQPDSEYWYKYGDQVCTELPSRAPRVNLRVHRPTEEFELEALPRWLTPLSLEGLILQDCFACAGPRLV